LASGDSKTHAVFRPSIFGLAPPRTLFLPDLSLPNQARTSSASLSAFSPVGISARRAPSASTESFSAASAGWVNRSAAMIE
jgi:hypothetical protein